MEHYKVSIKQLNDPTISKFITKKWIKVTDLSSGQYSVNKNVRFNISGLRSNLCDYSNAYIAVEETVTVEGDNDAIKRNTKLTFKNNTLFRYAYQKSITHLWTMQKILLLLCQFAMYLLVYSDNYSMISGRLWIYYRDELNDDMNENNVANNKITNNKTITNKSVEYKTKLINREHNNLNQLLGHNSFFF